MAALCNRAGHYIFVLRFFFLLLLSFFLAYSQPSQIGCLSYFHTLCGFSANLGCRSEMCLDTVRWAAGRAGIQPVKMGGWWRWALVSPDGVAPSRVVGVSASVSLPLHHKVQMFSSGAGSPGWSRKKGRKMVCMFVCLKCATRGSLLLLLEVDKPYVPPSCCVRNADGRYTNKYMCQMSIDRPPGLRRGEKNVYLHYPVSQPLLGLRFTVRYDTK